MNKLKLNTDKTELLILHSKFRSHIPFRSLMIENNVIFPSDHTRNIGVVFDEIMSYKKHIQLLIRHSINYGTLLRSGNMYQ